MTQWFSRYRGGGDDPKPSAPVLQGVAGDTVADLSWTVPAANGSAIAGYRVYRGGVLLATKAAGTVTHHDTGLLNGSTYNYQVVAVNSTEGARSNALSLTAQASAQAPNPPVLQVSAGDAAAALSWTIPANNGSALTGFRIYRNNVVPFTTVGPTVTSLLDSPLNNNTTYTYVVGAVNAVGETLSNAVPVIPTAPGSAPTLPANQTVGTPTAMQIGWGAAPENVSPNHYAAPGKYQLWWNRGHHGFTDGVFYLTNPAGGGSYDFKPSASNGVGVYVHQGMMEPTGGNAIAQANAVGHESYIDFYYKLQGQNGDAAPFGDWFDDSRFAAVSTVIARWAAFVEWVGMTGLAYDLELGQGTSWRATGYSGNTHTEAENRAKAFQRGKEAGAAMWGAFPGLRLGIYASSRPTLPGDYNNKLQAQGGSPYPDDREVMWNFLEGHFEAMRLANATGEILFFQAAFYRRQTAPAAAYKVDSQGPRAFLSTRFSQANWNYACRHLHIAPATWRGTDRAIGADPPGYNANQPSDAEWSQHVLNARTYAEGPRRWEYYGPGARWVEGLDQGVNQIYTTTAMINGAIAGSSTTPIPTSPPAITNLVASDAANTITCNVSHTYGILYVDVFNGTGFTPSNPTPSYLGTMRMTWNEAGGSYTTNYNSAFQACTFSTPIAPGQWFVIKAVSIKDDVAWARVQSN